MIISKKNIYFYVVTFRYSESLAVYFDLGRQVISIMRIEKVET